MMLNKPLFLITVLIASAAVCSGCVSVNARLEDRARVDQEIPGMPPQPVKTRKVIVFEVNEKGHVPKPVQKIREEELSTETHVGVEPLEEELLPEIDPIISADEPQGTFLQEAPAVTQKYTVEKDDTLQKIAKKVYGSYSQWTVIYDANKDVITNPNILKPGMVLQIPSVESPAKIPRVTE